MGTVRSPSAPITRSGRPRFRAPDEAADRALVALSAFVGGLRLGTRGRRSRGRRGDALVTITAASASVLNQSSSGLDRKMKRTRTGLATDRIRFAMPSCLAHPRAIKVGGLAYASICCPRCSLVPVRRGDLHAAEAREHPEHGVGHPRRGAAARVRRQRRRRGGVSPSRSCSLAVHTSWRSPDPPRGLRSGGMRMLRSRMRAVAGAPRWSTPRPPAGLLPGARGGPGSSTQGAIALGPVPRRRRRFTWRPGERSARLLLWPRCSTCRSSTSSSSPIPSWGRNPPQLTMSQATPAAHDIGATDRTTNRHPTRSSTTTAASGRPRKFAIWLFLATEVMFFTGLIGTYLVLRIGTAPGRTRSSASRRSRPRTRSS
jgi:hypothetical protein